MKRIISVGRNCIGCGACVRTCPKKILSLDPKTKRCKATKQSLCGRKGCCEKVCPTKAIKVKKD